MSLRIFAAVLVISCSLAGCATPYKSYGFAGGFSETQLDTNVFRVSFSGNGYTPAERAEDLALLRSAELTLKNGYTHFVIIDERAYVNQAAYTTPTQTVTTANATVVGNNAYGTARTTTTGGQTFFFSFPKSTNTIMCFKGKPDLQGMVYDAQFLCNSLGQKYSAICGMH